MVYGYGEWLRVKGVECRVWGVGCRVHGYLEFMRASRHNEDSHS